MVSSSPASRLLLAPCIKLLCLIIILPFIITYYHLQYYAYRRNEYCFVGRGWDDATATFFPPSSSAAAARSTSSGGDIDIVDNRLRGDSTTQSLLSMDGINDEHSVVKSEMIFGIYAPTISAAQLRQKKKRQKQPIEQRQFRQVYTTSDIATTTSILSRLYRNIGGVGYPSVTQLSAMISSPSSSASISNSNQHDITLVETSAGGKRWCLQSSTGSSSASLSRENVYCSDPLILPSDDDGSTTIYLSPPSGTWKKSIYSSNSSSEQTASSSLLSDSHIVVSCPSPTTISDSDAGRTTKKKHNSRWQQQNERQNQNVQSLLNQPATSLLLLLNIGLAFHYWNHRIYPSSVCKRYTNIVDEHEWWRGLSGATAHFEPLHIGFNCMSLHSLGRELEGERGLYGSIPFLVYNIALVVCTTMVMMGMVYARLRYIQTKLNDDSNNNNASSTLRTYYQEMHDRLRETSTVGYSAVLFAWMVVSTMERTQPTCPIPFLSDVCFETHSVPGIPSLKFNIAPVASLFLAQFIMPRASFMG
jgi:membrane associated rhomboid family serine protease